MADEWREATLGDIASFINGDRGKNYPSGDDFVSDGVPFISAADISDGGIDIAAAKRISRKAFERLGSGKIMPGDVLFCLRGSLGKAGRIADISEGAIASSLVIARAKQSTDARFLYYILQGPGVQGLMSTLDNGSVQPNLSVREISRIGVPDLCLSDQRAIAHILGTLDDKIELNRRMNETLEAMARALFQSWFVDFDPVRAKAEGRDPGLPQHLADLFPDSFVDSELGEIPKGWEVKGLDEIGRFLNGLALQKYPPSDGRSLPVIKIAQLRSGHTSAADQASADLDPDYIVNDGDILFSWSGSLECDLWAGGLGALNQHLFKVTSISFPRWLCYLGVHVHLDDFRLIAAGKATTMGHIQRHHLSDAKLPVPRRPLLDAMGGVLSPLVEAVWKRDVESRTLATLRDTLLPKLISGELRVSDAERFLERVAS